MSGPGFPDGPGGLDPAMLQQMMSSPQFAAVQQMLNSPEIRTLATQLQSDPSLMNVMKDMQSSALTGNFAGALSALQSNPKIMEVAQQMGQRMFAASPMAAALGDPTKKAMLDNEMSVLKSDPAFAEIIKELEANGPAAMTKFWNDPEVLKKFSKYGERLVQSGVFGAGDGVEGVTQQLEETKLEEAQQEQEEFVCLQDAVTEGDLELLKQILEAGIPADDADEEERTGLHFACGYGELDCANELLGRGANVNVFDSNKNTPLHYAAGYGQLEAVKLLLQQKGINVEAKNKEGHTPLDVAKVNEHKEIEEALLAAAK